MMIICLPEKISKCLFFTYLRNISSFKLSVLSFEKIISSLFKIGCGAFRWIRVFVWNFFSNSLMFFWCFGPYRRFVAMLVILTSISFKVVLLGLEKPLPAQDKTFHIPKEGRYNFSCWKNGFYFFWVGFERCVHYIEFVLIFRVRFGI